MRNNNIFIQDNFFDKDFFTKLGEFKKTNPIKLFGQMLKSKNGIKLIFLRVLLKINRTSLESIILNYLTVHNVIINM